MGVFRRWLALGRSRAATLRERLDALLGENDCEARGLRLLREWLSPDQLAQFNANRYFDVIGCDSGKKYRIRYGSSMNVEELDERGRSRACYCFLPDLHLVPGDIVLAQKIALEANESAALAVANKFTPRSTNFPVPY